LTGRVITTNSACTSGSQAIGFAYEAVKSGGADVMVAGGAEELSAADAAVFATLFAASTRNGDPAHTPAAFDRDRDGLVIGEGAGALVLEERDHAVARGAAIFAEVAGFATNSDGTHLTNPNRATQAACIASALENAGVSADAIAYVNAHGTATAAGDVSETGATFDVFKRAVPVSTLKNYIGHTLGACGAIEAAFTIEMMRRRWFAPNINLVNVDDACAPLDYITAGRDIGAEYVMSNNFAFGGINTSLVFRA
jgi:3-oxoacyl-[acyl-carrier-protein] synthase II